MWNTVISKKEHIIQYSRCLIVIACISLSLFALTSVACASSLASDEQTEHTFDRLTADGLTTTGLERLTADHVGVAAGAPSDTTPIIRAGAAVFGAAGGDDGAVPAIAEPDAGNGSDGAGGVVPPGFYMVEAEPDTPYTFSARGRSSDHTGTYEPLVYAMEVDCNGRILTRHNLNFGGCYDWVEKEIGFATSHNTSEFYVHANTWECNGTFQVEDVVLEVYGVPPAPLEPDAGNGSDGAGGVVPPGVYTIEAEPDTPYTFSARGISSDHAGTYEPLVYAMEVDCNGRIITQHILNFGGCYDWVEKEIAFTTSHNTSEFYVHANTWECDGTFQVEDVLLEVYEVPLPGVTDLGHTAGREWINWTWVNPDVVGFSYVMVYLDGVWQVNTSGSFYNAAGLDSGECYEIGTRTVGVDGGVSEVWVNQTGETAGDGDTVAGKVVHAKKEDFDGGMGDGVEVQKYGVITLERKNLLGNPSFEVESSINGLAEEWRIYNPSGGDYTTTLDTSTFTSGSKSQKITFASNDRAIYLIQHIYDVETNTDYTFSADVKVEDPDNTNAKLLIELYGDNGYISSGTSTATESTSFTRHSMTITTTSDTNEIRIFIAMLPEFSDAAGIMWVDSAQIETSSNPSPYAPCYTTTNGEYVSPAIDMGTNTTPYKIEWTSSVKPEGDLGFQLRSANSLEELNNSPWYGPTGMTKYYTRFEGRNLLLNPSLENDSNNDGIPDYSRQHGWGTNDRSYEVVNDAHEGSKTVKVEITDYTSGDARWEILYDGAIEEDCDYVFSVWHKENDDIGTLPMGIGFKKMDGSMIWWYSGKYMQSSADWKHDTFHFHTPSYEVAEIRLKIMLRSEGWIVSDAYSFEKKNPYDEWKIDQMHANSRLIQYKVDFSTTDQVCSPSLHDVSIKYGASVPEIQWTNVLADDGRQRYAFKPGETANFKVGVMDFKNITNIDHVDISIFDTSDNLVLNDSMAAEANLRDAKRYYEYSYIFPNNSAMGLWKVNIIAVNKEGHNCSENTFLKIRGPYTSPPQKMTMGVVAGDIRFDYSAQTGIDKYREYTGLEIWKRTIAWDNLEPEHDSFDEDYINKILEFMDGAHENGAKVQISLFQNQWPSWVNDGNDDSVERYEYKQTQRLAEMWGYLADKLKDHPALDSYLIINEENRIGDADDCIRSTNKVVSSIRTVDSNLSHRITIRPNTIDSYTRSRIAQDGIQDYNYGNTAYPTGTGGSLTGYESPISETSYLRMSRLRSSPVAYGCAGGVGEIGFIKTPMDTFGDEEKLAGFERAMSIAYDQGMDEFMIWDNGVASFADPETYFPKLEAFRDNLVTRPRFDCFDVRIRIDNYEWFYNSSSTTESALDMSNQPYKHLVERLDTGGYSWFYTHSDAVSLQSVCYKTTINFSEIKGKSEAEQDMLINGILENITPSGTKYL